MEGSQNSTFLSTSDVGLVVRRSNPIRIWGAEVKAALVGLILVEPSVDELAPSPFVPGVGHGTPSPLAAWHLLTASDRDRMIRQAMRMDLLQEVTVIVEHYIRVKSAQIFISTDLAALGAGDVFIVNVETVRSRFVVCFAWFDNERFIL
jgi:hypothetical protein